MRALQRKRLDAIRQEAGGRVLAVIGQVQFTRHPALLNGPHEPALSRSRAAGRVFALRRKQAVGLRHGALAGVEAVVLRQVVYKLVLEEGLHCIAGAGDNLVRPRRVGRRGCQSVALWSRVHPEREAAEKETLLAEVRLSDQLPKI